MEINMDVYLNDCIDFDLLHQYDALIISPGPGLPNDAGRLMEVIAVFDDFNKPILGVCLGMQALALYEGNKLYNQKQVKHGVSELAHKTLINSVLLHNIASDFEVGLYHSWAVKLSENSLFLETAISENGVLMSIEHDVKPWFAVQFHPESILTQDGKTMIYNFVKYVTNWIKV